MWGRKRSPPHPSSTSVPHQEREADGGQKPDPNRTTFPNGQGSCVLKPLTYTHTHINTHAHIYTCACTCTHIDMDTHTHICTVTYTQKHSCTHTRTYTGMHTHTRRSMALSSPAWGCPLNWPCSACPHAPHTGGVPHTWCSHPWPLQSGCGWT